MLPNHTVLISNTSYRAELFTKQPPWLKKVLERARINKETVLCGCNRTERTQIGIRMTSPGVFHLVGWRENGNQHSKKCVFFKEESSSHSSSASTSAVLHKRETGIIDVKLKTPLKSNKASQSDRPPSSRVPSESAKKTRGTASCRALLEVLVDETNLNYWSRHFDGRTWGLAASLLRETAKSMTIVGEKLQDRLITIVPGGASSHHSLIHAAHQSMEKYEKVVIVADIPFWPGSTKQNCRIPVKAGKTPWNMELWADSKLVKGAAGRHVQDICVGKLEQGRLIGLMIAEPRKKKDKYFLNVLDIGLIATNAHFIPVDSSYELSLCDYLVDQKRTFEKPVRLDGEDLLPDFVLGDTEQPVFMEVFGMASTEYLDRKRQKIKRYAERGLQLWQWDPTKAPDRFPQLPEAAK